MYSWTEKSVRWYAEAVKYTGFDKELSEHILSFLPNDETVCDLGCGIGYLALELARRGYDVTAVDHDAVALAWLSAERERIKPEKLTIMHQEWESLGEVPIWDNIVMVSAGGLEPEFYRRLCRKRLIIVDRAKLSSHVRADGRPSARRTSLNEWEQNVTFSNSFALEFGQPFRTENAAREYLEYMGGREGVEDTLKRLVTTDRSDFPLYLPYRKELTLRVYENAEE